VLSPKGNPTLNTLLAALKSVGMRLYVEPEDKARARSGKGNLDAQQPGSIQGGIHGCEFGA